MLDGHYEYRLMPYRISRSRYFTSLSLPEPSELRAALFLGGFGGDVLQDLLEIPVDVNHPVDGGQPGAWSNGVKLSLR